MSVSNSVAAPGFEDGDFENQAPKDHEVVGAMQGKNVEPADGTACGKIAAVGQQRVPAIYNHTTLTNDIKHTLWFPIYSRRERSLLSDAYLTALLTGTDATDLSDVETA